MKDVRYIDIRRYWRCKIVTNVGSLDRSDRRINTGGFTPLNTKARILNAKAMIKVILRVQETLYADRFAPLNIKMMILIAGTE